MSGKDDDYVEELRVVRSAKGAHRSKSKATPGYDRDLLRDEESLRGPSESRKATIEDVEEHLLPPGWAETREPERTEPTTGQKVGLWIADTIIDIVSDPEIQASVKTLWKVIWEQRRDQRARKQAARASAAAEITTGDGSGDTLEPVEPESEAIGAEAYNELLRIRLIAKEMLEHTEARLGEVHVEDDDQLPAEVQTAQRVALEGNLRDLDPQTLELLGFTWDRAADVVVPELVEREDPPELST